MKRVHRDTRAHENEYTKAQENETMGDEKMDHKDKESNKKENKNHQRNKGCQSSSRKEIRNKDNKLENRQIKTKRPKSLK